MKVIILDNNELSILKYAQEYPENWKRICEALENNQSQQHQEHIDGKGMECSAVPSADTHSTKKENRVSFAIKDAEEVDRLHNKLKQELNKEINKDYEK
jgi:hypothetical protein